MRLIEMTATGDNALQALEQGADLHRAASRESFLPGAATAGCLELPVCWRPTDGGHTHQAFAGKIGYSESAADLISTVWGVGYQFKMASGS